MKPWADERRAAISNKGSLSANGASQKRAMKLLGLSDNEGRDFSKLEPTFGRSRTVGTNGRGSLSEVVNAFVRRIRHIEAAKDERDLRVPPSVHYERLKKKYKGKDSMRLNREWRLIVSVSKDKQGKYVLIHEINNHYGD